MKTILYLILILAVFSCTPSTNWKMEKARQDSIAMADSLLAVQFKMDSIASSMKNNSLNETSKWDYSEDTDAMTGKIKKWATITSPDELLFDFPYNGGSYLTLTVRKKDGSTDVYLRISKGQFLTNDKVARLKFDDQQPITVGLIEPDDYSSDLVFLSGVSTIVNRMKKSKKLIVEVPFYQEGKRQCTFDISNFKW